MSFLSILQDEVEQVFLNANEFAEEITLNGLSVNAQVVWLQRDAALGQTPGLPQGRVRLHVSELTAPTDTEDGVVLDFNGEDWTVESSQRTFGMVQLTLVRSGSSAGRW